MHQPDYAEVYNNLGDTLRASTAISMKQSPPVPTGDSAQAEAFSLPYNNMGIALNEQRLEFEEAERAFRTAVQLDPGFATAHCNLANVHLFEQVKPDEAIAAYAFHVH